MTADLEIRINMRGGAYGLTPKILQLIEDGKIKDAKPIAPEVQDVLMSGAGMIIVKGIFYKKVEDSAYSESGMAIRILKYRVKE
ncbi:MAG: hypothetical protein AABX71_02255 [Nanoarchaeota archaeon]